MKRRYFFIVLLIIPLIAIGCTTDTEYKPGGDVTTPESPKLTILSHNMIIDEWGWATVEGLARNDGNERMDYAEIDVRFYNNAGHLIDTSFTNILDLDPGQTWAFEVMCFGEGAVSYDIGVGDIW